MPTHAVKLASPAQGKGSMSVSGWIIVQFVGSLPAARARPRQRTGTAGFTLLELMITVTILAIVAALAAPPFVTMFRTHRAKSVANELLAALNLARSEAARRGQAVSVCKSRDGSSCGGSGTQWDNGWMVFVNENAATEGSPAVRDSGELILQVRQNLPAGVTLRPNSNFTNYLTYSRTGRANQIGTFAVCVDSDETKAQAIVVNWTRAILATDSDGNGIPEKEVNGQLTDIGSCENP